MPGVVEGPVEIERRYLVRVRDEAWATLGPGVSLVQGYLSQGSPSVRIRVGESRGPVLTCKSGEGVRRREVEAVVPPEMAEALLEAAGDRVVRKFRYRVGPWEVDRFQGELEGLTLMEVELEEEDQPVPPAPDVIDVICEVTDDNAFTNNGLASLTVPAQRALVARVMGVAAP